MGPAVGEKEEVLHSREKALMDMGLKPAVPQLRGKRQSKVTERPGECAKLVPVERGGDKLFQKSGVLSEWGLEGYGIVQGKKKDPLKNAKGAGGDSVR